METEFTTLVFIVVVISFLTRIIGNKRATLHFPTGELPGLYGTNFIPEQEEDVEPARIPPSLNDVLRPEDFDLIVKETERLSEYDIEFRSDLWDCPPTEAGLEELENLGTRLRRAFEPFAESPTWKLAAMTAGLRGGPDRELWDKLLSLIDTGSNETASAQETLIRYAPTLSDKMPLETQECVVQEILRHLEDRGKLGMLTLLARPSWKRFIHHSSVASGQPRIVEHFRALLVSVRLQILHDELAGRWDRQMATLGAPSSSEFGDELGRTCSQFSPAIRHCLEWYDKIWSPLERDLKSIGFRWDAFIEEQPPNFTPYGEIVRLREATINSLTQVISARSNAIKWRRLKSKLEHLTKTITLTSEGHTSSPVASRMLEAVSNLDSMGYHEAYQAMPRN
ncbi:MAG: hypothetical protein ACE5I0_04400 [Candidatus Binatia bacterium]